jgi:6-phosphogluconolactonase
VIVRVYEDLATLSRAAAELFCQKVAAAVKERGRCDVALSGGSTPRQMYELLATAPWRTRIDWRRLHVFWGDERCVPPDDPRSNARMAREALLSRVEIPTANIHPISCLQDPPRAAVAYEEELRGHFGGGGPPRWDLLLLGLGADGHTASLFPGGEAVNERERWVAAVPRPEAGLHGITLTPPALNGAATAVFLVAGHQKEAALRSVRQRPADPHRCPAQVIAPRGGEVLFLVDREAAGEAGASGEAPGKGGGEESA